MIGDAILDWCVEKYGTIARIHIPFPHDNAISFTLFGSGGFSCYSTRFYIHDGYVRVNYDVRFYFSEPTFLEDLGCFVDDIVKRFKDDI